MVRVNRATEYALISLLHMRKKEKKAIGSVSTAREISRSYGLPFEITAKTLQKLKSEGFIQSFQGVQGGYILERDLEKVDLASFLLAMEGGQKVVACCEGPNLSRREIDDQQGCDYFNACGIRPFMQSLNLKVSNFLSQISLAELEEQSDSGTNQLEGRTIET